MSDNSASELEGKIEAFEFYHDIYMYAFKGKYLLRKLGLRHDTIDVMIDHSLVKSSFLCFLQGENLDTKSHFKQI